MRRIVLGENLEVLRALPAAFARLIYVDPPFNTGQRQQRRRIRAQADAGGERTGFGGRRYRVTEVESASYTDRRDDWLDFLMERLEASLRCLTPDGSLFVHLDPRESHHAKVALDGLLGRECFMNEIVWAYDFGGRGKRRWPAKHDVILWYALEPGAHVFDLEAVDRIPYMAPGLVSPEKARRGKTPTDVWWHTIVPTNGREKTGYPTQKPEGLVRRFVHASSRTGDLVLDPFAGSGTLGAVAAATGRRYLLMDAGEDAVRVMRERLGA
jgi:site-specific DNA-methyltransferase (adenine-specific)